MSDGRCPYCGDTCIADTMNGRRYCLDCERTWQPGGRKGHRGGRKITARKNRRKTQQGQP